MTANHRISADDIPDTIEGVLEAPNREEFLKARFTPAANIIRMRRPLTGNFEELAMRLMQGFSSASENRLYFVSHPYEFHQRSLWELDRFMKSIEEPSLREALQVVIDDKDFLLNETDFNKVQVRIVNVYTSGTAHAPHIDYTSCSGYGRFSTCYTKPSTMGYKPADVVFDGKTVRVNEGAVPIELGIGDYSRHAVGAEKNAQPYIHYVDAAKNFRLLTLADRSHG